MGSSSGSRINTRSAVEQKLKKGDQIKMGKTMLVYLDKSAGGFFERLAREGNGWKQSTGFLKSWQSRYLGIQRTVLFYWKSQKDVRNFTETSLIIFVLYIIFCKMIKIS